MKNTLILREQGNPPFHRKLCCFVHYIKYDFDTKIGEVGLDDGCTDMTGAIELFTAIDPDVQKVITVLETGKTDTVYTLGRDGEWHAFDPLHGRMS